MNVGELTATFDVEVDGAGFVRAEAAMEGLRRGADGRLRDLRGRFVSESRLLADALRDGIETGTAAVEEATSAAGAELADGLGEGGEEASRRLLSSLTDAELAVEGFTRSSNGRIRDLRGRFVAESATIADALRAGVEAGTQAAEDAAGDADIDIDVNVDSTDAEAGIGEVETSLAELRRQAAETATSVRRDLNAALRRLPTVRIDADSTPLDEQLVRVRHQLRDLAAERVGITVTTEEASRRLAALTAELETLSREHPSPSVNLGVRQATEQIVELRVRLAELSGETVDIRVNTETARARAELAEIGEEARHSGDDGGRLGRILSQVGDAAGPIGSVAGRISLVAGAVGGALPLVAGLSAALVSILPAAGVAATGLLMVASAGAAIKIGSSGIGAAIKAAFADAPAATGAAASGANQYASAQRAVKDAAEQAAYANEQAARRVSDAERNLADAQRASLQVQQALDDARRQAAQDLEDLNNKLIDAGLSERDAVLRVQEAQDALTAATADGSTATARQREQAQLALDQARQRLVEQGIAYRRLQQEAQQANAAGVEGSARVVQAQDRIVQAQRQVQDQTRALQDAQVQQSRTAAQGAEQVQRAIEALHQAGAGAAAGGVDPLAAAMAKLSPNAREFVAELIRLKPALSDLKWDVQQTLFQGFAGSLRFGAETILPVLHTALVGSAQQLNVMGRAAIATAGEMAENGTLGRAFASANKGLAGLTKLPSVFVQAVSQIGAAAGPAFERFGAAANSGLERLSQKMTAAFNSGGMQRAIDTAIDLLGQLGDAAGNFGRFFGEVLGATQQSGGGFIHTLVVISDALAKAFAEPAIQAGLQALFRVTAAVATTAAPLLISALRVIGPVLAALGPPVQVLLDALGSQGLQPIISALGPVLLAAAQAVGQLVLAATPLLGLIGSLVSLALPALTPLLAGAETIFRQLAPVVAAVATALMGLLGPILVQLPTLIEPFVTVLTTLTGVLLPVLTDLLTQLPLAQLGQSFADVAVALAPLLAQVAVLVGQWLKIMLPLLTPIITAVVQLAAVFGGVLAEALQRIVVPALQMVTQLLSGDFSGALRSGRDLLVGIGQTVLDVFTELPRQIARVLADLASAAFDGGKGVISSLIDGMRSMGGKAIDAVKGIVSDISEFFPHSPARVGPFSGRGYPLYSGQAISAALAEGITSGQSRVRQATASLMGTAQGGLGLGQLAAPGGATAGTGTGSGFHIEHYYEAEQGDARRTAAELAFMARGRG